MLNNQKQNKQTKKTTLNWQDFFSFKFISTVIYYKDECDKIIC